ncbi:MAG: hypothetical protein DRJ42_27595 [Deltaproteobacteria bacterium]|nr:MAG: hypothetical protein DRJ42_27595 [Deltaproteobacteria bacterium]
MALRILTMLVVAATGLGCGHAPPPDEEQPSQDPVNDVEATDLFRQGLGMAGAGDMTRAEQYIGAAIVRGYPEERALPVLIRICVAASRLRAAVTYAEPYLDRNPNDATLRLVVASLYLGLDEAVKARRHLEQVLAVSPDEPEAHYLMALVLRDEVGDARAAKQHFARYLELDPTGDHHEEVAHALTRIELPVPHPAPGSAEHDEGGEASGDEPADTVGEAETDTSEDETQPDDHPVPETVP